MFLLAWIELVQRAEPSWLIIEPYLCGSGILQTSYQDHGDNDLELLGKTSQELLEKVFIINLVL